MKIRAMVIGIILLSVILALTATGFLWKPKIILMYHAVAENISSEGEDENLFVRPDDFEHQLQMIAERNLATGFLDEKADVYITLDDGYENNYANAFPLLKKYRMKATIFVVVNLIGTKGYLTSDMIQEMSRSGLVSIQSHGMTHNTFTSMDEKSLISELNGAKSALEKITGQEVYAISYPCGEYNGGVVEKAQKIYQIGVTTKTPNLYNSHNDMTLPRIGVPREIDNFEWLLWKFNLYDLLT